ncbi:hypothetical protein L1049_028319 [Liquidambar formosana]|uniref:DUF789 domain-containing protein n=1 Tax=Liquidambar formosana TaxID=63359 RepID=A0AAP0RK80_LIQFO
MSSSTSTTAPTNLERFLQSMTPTVPSQSLPQSCIRGLNSLWQHPGKDSVEYFTLGDLWECYDEWSAYGVGTSVVLDSGETVTQYYVPYLSAIQIYADRSLSALRNSREESDAVGGFESDSWSDESESDKLSRSLSNNSSRAWDATSEESSLDHDRFMANEG